MQRLQFALFEIDEAKRYLLDGSVPALRVALILLDNAAEVLLDRWIAQDLAHDALLQRIQESVRTMGVPEDHNGFSDLFRRRFLTAREKRQVARVFDEKIRYVAEVKGKLPSAIGAVLSHLHRYRNEAHHSGRVRPETLRTSVTILLELCCELLTSLMPDSSSYSSLEDYSWLERRWGMKPAALWNQETLARIATDLRAGLPITDFALRQTLAENLEGRLQQLDEALDFITGESRVEINRATALTDAQQYALEELKNWPPYRPVPKGLDELVSLDDLERLALVPDAVSSASDTVTVFEVYADADIELERIEFLVGQLAAAIDEAIQLEIDRARGK